MFLAESRSTFQDAAEFSRLVEVKHVISAEKKFAVGAHHGFNILDRPIEIFCEVFVGLIRVLMPVSDCIPACPQHVEGCFAMIGAYSFSKIQWNYPTGCAIDIRLEFGKINILVNNAGTIGKQISVKDMSVEERDHLISVDLRGVFLSSKYFIPLIATDPVGKIINITSELSRKGRAGYAHYCAAKGGINSFTRSLALELAPDVLVSTIAPGPVETDMIMADREPEWIEKEKDIPLRRLGKVEEIAATAVLLGSDDGNFFYGQIISPNGGAAFF